MINGVFKGLVAAGALLAVGVAGTAQAGDVLGSDGTVPSAEELTNALKAKPKTRGLNGLTFRGVNIVDPTTGEESTEAQPTVVEPPPTVNLSVNFEFGSAILTKQAMSMLDNLGSALTSDELDEFAFKIEGHTDAVGGSDFNQTLSERRALSVQRYLEHRHDIPGSRLESIGMGEQRLLDPDHPEDPMNRRVQITNIGKL